MVLPTFVYHYTTARTAIDYILRGRSLRLGSLSGVNDPKESKFRDFTFYARGAKSIANFKSSLFDEVCGDLASNTYALCCGVSGENHSGREDGALHPHMWANYAGRHTGVCLVLDKELLHEGVVETASGSQIFCGEVKYHDLDGLGSLSAPAYSLYLEDWCKDREGYFDFHVSNYSEQLFFLKHKDWRDESEYRWIVRSRAGSQFFVDISKALVRVIVGHEMSEPDLYYVKSQCAAIGVPVHRVIWNSEGSLSVDLSEPDAASTLQMQLGFSRDVPCSATFHRITNGVGDHKVVAVSARTGGVVFCGESEASRDSLHALGYTDEEANVEINPTGFSAGRLAETDRRPLDISVSNGEIRLAEGEEIPYYGMNFIAEA